MRRLTAGLALVALPVAASAHADPDAAIGWWSWNPDPLVLLSLAVAVAWYARGAKRRRSRLHPGEPVCVYSGLFVIFIALVSPVDPLGEASYFMHQVQHLLLRSIAPLVLFLPSPSATFIAGAPGALRRFGSALAGSRPVRVIFRALLHPVTVTLLFIASAWIWQWPPYFTAALLDPTTHNWMHFTMLGAGVLFWWRVFDERPSAPGYGVRIVMLSVATAANVILGKMLTLKDDPVVYEVYDELGRVWLDGATDEQVGGLIVWIPGSQMALIGLLIVIWRWGRRQERDESHRLRRANTAAVPARAGIQRQALALATLSLGILAGFAIWIFWVMLNR